MPPHLTFIDTECYVSQTRNNNLERKRTVFPSPAGSSESGSDQVSGAEPSPRVRVLNWSTPGSCSMAATLWRSFKSQVPSTLKVPHLNTKTSIAAFKIGVGSFAPYSRPKQTVPFFPRMMRSIASVFHTFIPSQVGECINGYIEI